MALNSQMASDGSDKPFLFGSVPTFLIDFALISFGYNVDIPHNINSMLDPIFSHFGRHNHFHPAYILSPAPHLADYY